MRVKTGTTRHRRHKKVLEATKGMRLARGTRYKVSHESLLHKGMHEYIGRRLRKRDMRKLWIIRINAGLSQVENGPSYSVFMNQLKQKGILLNRKMLAELAARDLDTFKQVVSTAYGK